MEKSSCFSVESVNRFQAEKSETQCSNRPQSQVSCFEPFYRDPRASDYTCFVTYLIHCKKVG